MGAQNSEKKRGLNPRRRRFCDAYALNGGNACAAARAAGYKQPEVEGARLLRQPAIVAALDGWRETETRGSIATRQERQEFWTTIARDTNENMRHRLKAAELLGKSQADFIDRKEITGAHGAELNIAFYLPKNGREK